MCLAIYKPAGVVIPDDYLIHARDDNPHGAGVAWDDGERVHIVKGIFDVQELLDTVCAVEDVPAAVHLRYATHGAVNKGNCHPFKVNKKLALIHNGIIPGFGAADYSDTRHFTDVIVKPIGLGALDVPETYFEGIGNSKLVLLGAGGRHRIVNESLGHWNNGVWYSNHSYQAPVYMKSRYDSVDAWRSIDDEPTSWAESWAEYCNYREEEKRLIDRILRY